MKEIELINITGWFPRWEYTYVDKNGKAHHSNDIERIRKLIKNDEVI